MFLKARRTLVKSWLCPLLVHFWWWNTCIYPLGNTNKNRSHNAKYPHTSHHLREIDKDLDVLTPKYVNIILMGDFNAEPAVSVVFDFCEIYNLKNIIREKPCFKNPNNASCIDLIITNRPKILWLLRQVYLTFTKFV